MPDRCMRQFGMIQDIPADASYSSDLHFIDLKGKTDVDWRTAHRAHILIWDTREQHVVAGDVGDTVVDDYDRWYTNITRRFHTHVGGAQSYMLDLLDHVSSIAMGVIHGGMDDIDHIVSHGRRVILEQFSHGVSQDFPVEVRREKEIALKAKKIRVGHRGGRGGVNAPRRRDLVVADHAHEGGDDAGHEGGDEVVDHGGGDGVDQGGDEASHHVGDEGGHHAGDEGGDHAGDEGGDTVIYEGGHRVIYEGGDTVIDEGGHRVIDEGYDLPILHPTSQSSQSTLPLSHPTFNLLTQSSPEPVEQREMMQLRPRKRGAERGVQPYVKTFTRKKKY